MEKLSLKDLTHLAMMSHETCRHRAMPNLCIALIATEVQLRRGYEITEEEFIQVGAIVADKVLESLILKGVVEVEGMDENGEMLFQLTEEGEERLGR